MSNPGPRPDGELGGPDVPLQDPADDPVDVPVTPGMERLRPYEPIPWDPETPTDRPAPVLDMSRPGGAEGTVEVAIYGLEPGEEFNYLVLDPDQQDWMGDTEFNGVADADGTVSLTLPDDHPWVDGRYSFALLREDAKAFYDFEYADKQPDTEQPAPSPEPTAPDVVNPGPRPDGEVGGPDVPLQDPADDPVDVPVTPGKERLRPYVPMPWEEGAPTRPAPVLDLSGPGSADGSLDVSIYGLEPGEEFRYVVLAPGQMDWGNETELTGVANADGTVTFTVGSDFPWELGRHTFALLRDDAKVLYEFEIVDKPGEDKPGEDKPGGDKPGKDEPGEDEPGEDEPGEDGSKGSEGSKDPESTGKPSGSAKRGLPSAGV